MTTRDDMPYTAILFDFQGGQMLVVETQEEVIKLLEELLLEHTVAVPLEVAPQPALPAVPGFPGHPGHNGGRVYLTAEGARSIKVIAQGVTRRNSPITVPIQAFPGGING